MEKQTRTHVLCIFPPLQRRIIIPRYKTDHGNTERKIHPVQKISQIINARQGTTSLKDKFKTNTNKCFRDGRPQQGADAERRGPVLSEHMTPARYPRTAAPPRSAEAAQLGATGTRCALTSAPCAPCPCRRAVAAVADWPLARGRARVAAGECERWRVSAGQRWGTEPPGAGRAMHRVGGVVQRELGSIACPHRAPLLPGGS